MIVQKERVHPPYLTAGLTLVGASFCFFMYCHSGQEFDDVNSLSPSVPYLWKLDHATTSSLYGSYEDVDGNGKLEAVLRIKTPLGGVESRLVEKLGDQIVLRKFDVVDGKIIYLSN